MYRYINEKDLNAYEKDNKRLSYANLFYDDDALILCNNIAYDYEDLELVNGDNYDEEYDEYLEDIYQYYIIDYNTAQRLIDETNEIIYYHNRLDIYILGVTHFGTNWGYILTEFELVETEDKGCYKAVKIDDNEDNDNGDD